MHALEKELFYDNLSEEQMVRAYIEAKIPVMLHGIPGVGKTSLVKQIDPEADVVSIHYKTLEGLMGKTVYNPNTGAFELIKPEWLVRHEKRCEKTPDKTCVLFFDEINDSPPTMASSAYQVVLERMVNDTWTLPANSVMMAAGNEVSDSSAAFDMPAPLHSRFAHVSLPLSADRWLAWAAKNDIHKSVLGFIAWKKESGLSTPFTGTEPNADPRKWERVSNLLKKTSQVRAATGLIGYELAGEFEAFTRIKMPTIQDVIAGKAAVVPANDDTGARYAIMGALSFADEKEIYPVWDYVLKYPRELQLVFARLWTMRDAKNRIIYWAEKRLKGGEELYKGMSMD